MNLDAISDEELLDVKICDLPIQIKGTWLEECIEQLYAELDASGVLFKPVCYLADEWLTPGLDWRARYKGWKALEKLEYVNALMEEVKGKKPVYHSQRKFWRLSSLRMKLRTHYTKKRHYWAEEFPDFHDRFLRKVFAEADTAGKSIKAADVIKKFSGGIVQGVSKYSGEKKYVINDLVKDIVKRSRELRLVSPQDESVIVMHVTGYVTALIMNYLYTGRFRRKKI